MDNEELLKSQYDVLAGKLPEKYNEVVLVADQNNRISDYTLYSLGLLDQDELEEKYEKIEDGEEVEESEEKEYSYDEILNTSFKLLLNANYYKKENDVWMDKSEDEDYIKEKLKDAEEIKIVGIVKQNEESAATEVSSVIGYTKELKEYVIEKTNEADIVKEQKKNKDINVFTGTKFPKEDSKEFDFSSLSNEQKMYMASLSQEELAKLMSQYTENANATYEGNLEK